MWPMQKGAGAYQKSQGLMGQGLLKSETLRLLNALNSEDRGLKVRFSLASIAFDRESAQMSQILSSQGKNAPSDPYPHYLVRLAASRKAPDTLKCLADVVIETFLGSTEPFQPDLPLWHRPPPNASPQT